MVQATAYRLGGDPKELRGLAPPETLGDDLAPAIGTQGEVSTQRRDVRALIRLLAKGVMHGVRTRATRTERGEDREHGRAGYPAQRRRCLVEHLRVAFGRKRIEHGPTLRNLRNSVKSNGTPKGHSPLVHPQWG